MTHSTSLHALFAGLLALGPWWTGCPAADDDAADDDAADDDAGDDDSATGDDDSAGDDDTTDMPPDPSPFTMTVSGAINEQIVFDSPTCEMYPNPSFVNFRHFWRGAHNGVLVIDVLGVFDGAGTYDQTMGNVRVKLQAEAPLGTPYDFFYQTDSTSGDTTSITVEYIDDEVAWGEATVSGLHGLDGAVTFSPATFPIWCPDVWD